MFKYKIMELDNCQTFMSINSKLWKVPVVILQCKGESNNGCIMGNLKD